jgi:hypothetical protein
MTKIKAGELQKKRGSTKKAISYTFDNHGGKNRRDILDIFSYIEHSYWQMNF